MGGRRWLVGLGMVLILFGFSACGAVTPGSRQATNPPSTTQSTGTGPTGTAPTGTPTTTTGSATTSPSGGDIEGTDIEKLPQVPEQADPPSVMPKRGEALNTFLRSQFDDIQEQWAKTFAAAGLTYVPAALVFYTGQIETACGTETSEVGPFYCPGDSTVYLDTSFFTLMEKQFGVTGNFAPAYVVAHEVGHHVQALLGISSQVAALDQADPAGMNARSVRVELQADCLAGVWAHSVNERGKLNDGDLDSALRAAASVGDDFLTKISGGETDPDTFTHGTSAQRQQWLKTGFESGDPNSCDTFGSEI